MPGDDIRTLTQSGALITFFVGTEIELGEATVLRVDQISRQGDQIDVSLTQVYGSAVHRVQALANTGSSYRVEAGGAVALVRGTEFGWWYYPPSVHVLGVFEGMVECLDQQEANNPNSPAQSDPNRLRTEGGYISQSNSCAVSDTFKIDKDDPWGTLSRGLGIALVQSNPAESGDEDDDEELADAEEEEEEEEEQSQDEPDDRDDGDDGGDQDDGDDGGDQDDGDDGGDDDGDDGGDDDDGDGGDDDDDGGDDGGDEDDD
jgi:hypothetical protein